MEQSGLTRWNVTKLAVLYTLHFQSKEFSQKWNDIEKPKKKSEKRELAQNKWYNQMEQVDTSLSMRNKWNKEQRVSRSTWNKWNKNKGTFRSTCNKWNKDKGSVQINLSTCTKVGLQDRENFNTEMVRGSTARR